MRIRLHGTRLPSGYTVSMRLLTINNRHEQPRKPVRKRRRKQSYDRCTTPEVITGEEQSETDIKAKLTPVDNNDTICGHEIKEQDDEQVRLTNAYPGATNSINSIHQRRWYLSMDRYASGFEPQIQDDGTRKWVRRTEDGRTLGFEPFFVRGRDSESSIVTGRTADEVMRDEGVKGFIGRKGWRPVLE